MSATPDVSVVTSGHDVADARLHREVKAFLAAGLSVEVLGLGAAQDAPPGASVRTWPRVGGVRRARLAVTMARQARGRILFTLDPDSAVAAAATRLIGGRRPVRPRLVVDVHEDYADLLRDRSWAHGLRAVLAGRLVTIFTAVAERADLTVVADHHVRPLTARHRLVVRNEADLSLLPAPEPPEHAPRALYVGDLRASRGLFAMVEAIRLTPDWSVDLVGPVAPADQDRLRAMLAGDPELSGRVRLHGRMPPRQAWRLASGAWAGLLLLSDTPAFRRAEPSKLTEYLACGLPVMTTDLPRQAAVVRNGRTGVVVSCAADSPLGADVAAVLRSWSADPTRLRQLRDAAVSHARTLRGRPTGYRTLAAALIRIS